MVAHLPLYLSLVFIATTLLTLAFLYRATHYSRPWLLVWLFWLGVQGLLGFCGFYLDTHSMPPRFLLLMGPWLVFIALLFLTPKGRLFMDHLDLRTLTLLHVVRVPVELVLLGLYLYGLVPGLMTFEGRNFDLFSGITAPLVMLLAWKGRFKKGLLLAWNLLCLGLLLNIVIHAILSAPTPFQQLAFEQPNTGVLFFPFVWLPGFVVPVVLLAHLAGLRQLLVYRPV